MVEIRRSTVVRAPLEAVWAVLRNFNGHDRWHPAVASSAIEEGAESDQVGAVRNFQLMDGGRIREHLLALSDVELGRAERGVSSAQLDLQRVVAADRKPDGKYRQDNVMRYVVAAKP